MNTEFDISKFNIIQDEENYYFFRALNMGDNEDIETGITAQNGEIQRIRTDRARWVENPENREAKYAETDELSLEQMYDHIKWGHRKDTNCMSLSSNANVSVDYGRGYYKDRYVLVKVPKSEFGGKVKVAGEYMLSEIEKKVQSEIEKLSNENESELLERIKKIDEAASTDEIVDTVFSKFNFTGEEKVYTSKNGKKITAQNMRGRFSSYQALSEEQNLEKNKLVAKLTVLEYFSGMDRLIPRTGNNSNLLATVGLAFTSLELINYGEIEKENFTEIPSRVMDMLSILQQAREKITDVDREELEIKQKLIEDLESRIIQYAVKGYDLKTQDGKLVFTNGEEIIDLGNSEDKSITNEIDNFEEPSIEKLYNLTKGKMSYEKARGLIQKSYYASRAKLRANEIIEIISQIAGESEEEKVLLNDIKNECFVVEPKIIARASGAGYKLSESISIAATQDEIELINEIKTLSEEELKINIASSLNENIKKLFKNRGSIEKQDGNEYNVEYTSLNDFNELKTNDKTEKDKNTYYAEAIVSLYDFNEVGIKFTDEQHELFISKLKELDLSKIYEQVRNAGVAQTEIARVILNICMNEKFKEQINDETFANQIKENIEELSESLYSEQIEDFLGFYDIEGTGIKLKGYQIRTSDNIDKIYEDKRFAVAIMPTGSGKSFIAMAEMLKEKYNLFDLDVEKRKKMLYVAPSNEILEQFINNLVENVIGTKESLGKTNAQLLKEKFPNLEFTTYANLKNVEKNKYDLIILDELHRTGAKKWGKHLDKLLKNQDEITKILGITATPERDVDGRNMADELALKLGYTEEEIKNRKHVAIKMDLMDAIRNGIVVNPNLVTCEYSALTSERFIKLEQEINEIEDETIKTKKIAEYEELRRNLSNADGVKEILNNNLKVGGKYIVFIPVGSEGEDVEDEFGNKIAKKSDAEAKVQAQVKELEKYFEGTGKKIKCYSMLGAYSDKENSKNLHGFENGAKDEINFLVVINKANEGLHIKGTSGIIWFRALDKNSRILMTQHMGRCIYAIDKDNPIPEDEIPIIIDLPNNTMTVDFQKAINTYTDIDDLEMLRDIIDWMEKHNGNLPDIESKGREEQRKAITLKRIQEKYLKYYDENYDNLDEEEIERINQILSLGEEIDLWNLELPDKKDKDGKVVPVEKLINIDTFKLEGNLKKLCELEDEVKTENEKTAIAKTLEVARILKENGVDLRKIKLSRTENKKSISLTLGEILQEEIDINKIIEENDLDVKFPFGKRVHTLRLAYNGIVNSNMTEDEKQEAEELGLVKTEKKTAIAELIEIAKVLKENGIDLSKLQLIKEGKYFTLGELKQKGVNILRVIEENELDKDFPLGYRIYGVRQACNGRGTYLVTEDEKREVEELGLLSKERKPIIAELLEVASVLNKNGVDLTCLQLTKTKNGKTLYYTLGELEQEGIDIQRIIEENGLDEEFPFGNRTNKLRQVYNGKKTSLSITEEERKKAENIGLVKAEKKTVIAETIEVANVLKENGVDFSILQLSKTKNGKTVYCTLGELEQDGIDIQRIIEENSLNVNFEFGRKVNSLRRTYKGTERYLMTETEKCKAEELGLVEIEEKKSAIAELIEIAKILKENGVDISKLQLSKKRERKKEEF